MFESKRVSLSSKAILGLVVTIFVASACSHKDILKDDQEATETQQAAIENETPPAPVFATEPDSVFEQSKTPEPSPTPYKKAQKIAKHKVSKKAKKHHTARRHKKVKKIAKNHKFKQPKEIQPSTAAGTINQLPPPPPPPQAPPMPNFADNAQLSPVVTESSSAGYQWLYIGTAFAIALGLVGFRYRGKFTKKSRRLIFNS